MIPEIREWRKSTPYRRTALLRELSRRVQQVRLDGRQPSPQDGRRTSDVTPTRCRSSS
ncbi:hypothetical protein [Microvirga sp. M2]|uniref:hypothetical protein n=1 Tax=Microvirga sp. M2 TaxID=3073270 RepID=UPI0039C31BA0